jgi:hypothetical protein
MISVFWCGYFTKLITVRGKREKDNSDMPNLKFL